MPLYLFIIVWAIQIILYLFSPYPYHHISTGTWSLIVITILMFMIGFLTSYFFNFNRPLSYTYINDLQYRLDFSSSRVEICLKILIILVGLGMVGDLILLNNLIKNYGLNPYNIFWYRWMFSYLAKTNKEWNLMHSIFNYMLALNYLALLLSAFYEIFVKKKMFLVYLPMLLALLFSLFTLQRYLFICSLVIWISSFFYLSFFVEEERRKILLTKLLRRISLVFIIFIFIILIVISIRINIRLGVINSEKLIEYSIQSIYSYIAGNIVALDVYLEKDLVFKMGGEILQSFYKWFARIGMIAPEQVSSKYLEFTNIGQYSVNTYTFIRNFYEDFGIFSLLTLTYFWAILIHFLVNRLFSKPSLTNVFIVSYFVFSVVISFFSFALLNLTMFFFFLLVIYLCDRYILNIRISRIL